MASIAYHASHEQFAPSHLLQLVQLAEKTGFDAIHSSDHFHPWSERQGHSGFAFAWLGAAMQSTTIPYSVVCSPGQRYHPAIVAQAVATLAEMFPGRFGVELGSGEGLNERITADPWPSKNVRNRRLFESATVIRKLLSGEETSAEGHIRIANAKLYTRPQELPPLFCAALTEATAAWAGSWADGLLTNGNSTEEVEKKCTAFVEGGGAGKPIYLQYAFSYAPSREEALQAGWEQWRTNVLPSTTSEELFTPAQYDEAAKDITPGQVEKVIDIFDSIKALLDKISQFAKLPLQRIILHNVARTHVHWMEDLGKNNWRSIIS